MPIVCTEVGAFNADVIGLNTEICIEVEVKRTRSDLLRDFTNKKTKHYVYNKGFSNSPFMPNYFYYLVPESLGPKALEIVKEKSLVAGLAVLLEGDLQLGKNIQVLAKAKKIHDAKPKHRLVQNAMLRMSSELVGLHSFNSLCRNKMFNEISNMHQNSFLSSLRLHGHLDSENLELDRELRAMELAECVEQISAEEWTKLSKDDKNKWLVASDKWLEARCKNAEFPESWYK